MKPDPRHNLALRVLRTMIFAALLVGLVSSLIQITLGTFKVQSSIDTAIDEALFFVSRSLMDAVNSDDTLRIENTLNDLTYHHTIQSVSLNLPDGTAFAHVNEQRVNFPFRWFSDRLLGPNRTVARNIVDEGQVLGRLIIVFDTAPYGKELIQNIQIILLLALLHVVIIALLLYLICRWLLNQPLLEVIQHLSEINPEQPGSSQIPSIKGHQNDELGLWVDRTNQLIHSIKSNTSLRQEAENNLIRASKYDTLTSLPNRLLLQERLSNALERAQIDHQKVSVLGISLDDFKGINEQFGYHFGDQLLIAVASRLREYNLSGTIGRLGGDLFAMVQTGILQPYQAAQLAQSILDCFKEPFTVNSQQVRLSATIGIALFPEDGKTAEKLLQKAEQTMMLAKHKLHNHYQFYVASIDREIRYRRRLEKELFEVLARNELYLVYQPQFSYEKQRISGMEALVRWQHPTFGSVPPDIFIPLAEQCGTILQIGNWIVERACKQLRQWLDEGHTDLRVAVNLSTVQLHHQSLPGHIKRLLEKYRLPAGSLELEVTETTLVKDVYTAHQHLHSLRQAGAMIAIDDFGIGHSSLNYLKALPLDKIKIDKSFIRDVLHDKGDALIVQSIIQLANNLGMKVTAEGVETREQEMYLIDQGCHEGQGYYYGKPSLADELADCLSNV